MKATKKKQDADTVVSVATKVPRSVMEKFDERIELIEPKTSRAAVVLMLIRMYADHGIEFAVKHGLVKSEDPINKLFAECRKLVLTPAQKANDGEKPDIFCVAEIIGAIGELMEQIDNDRC